MDVEKRLGLTLDGQGVSAEGRQQRLRQVNLQLVASGLPATTGDDADFSAVAGSVLESFRARARLLSELRCPADARIEAFLQGHFQNENPGPELRLPDRTVILGQHGDRKSVV